MYSAVTPTDLRVKSAAGMLKVGTILLIGFWLCVTSAQAQNDSTCDQVLIIAEELFFYAQFDEASQILEGCLAADMISPSLRFDAYQLIARIYYADQRETEAADAVNEMLNFRPGYIPAPPLPPPFIAFVEYQSELRQRKEVLDIHLSQTHPRPLFRMSRRGWFFIGGGVLATGTAIALISGGESEPASNFPRPPGPPVR